MHLLPPSFNTFAEIGVYVFAEDQRSSSEVNNVDDSYHLAWLLYRNVHNVTKCVGVIFIVSVRVCSLLTQQTNPD